ncbi:MAG: helix-turn-helix domain-containing protein [Chloroflexi bacterium]|nr:helix-turn-helix domain-containing protein [Chloroflexota bacterium]
MNAPRPSDLIPALRAAPEIDAAYARRYPLAGVALAVARLRARLGLTQAEFAAELGTTQSVIARLESGRHGFQVSLLNRIGAAFGTGWAVSFGAGDLTEREDATRPIATIEPSGDALLDAFNTANTTGDTERAHRIALRIARDPSTARRRLAIALDAINRGDNKKALEGAQTALDLGLNARSASVARIVEGRALIGLKRPEDALEVLADVTDHLAVATRIEALIELDRADEAVNLGERLVADADERSGALAAYSAARAYWHADRPFQALDQVVAYRVREPNDPVGTMLQGAILGYIGDSTGKMEPYRLAMELFRILPDEEPETWRLRAMTAARLGDWREALAAVSRTVALGTNRPPERASATKLVAECLDRVRDAEVLDQALDVVANEHLLDEPELGRRRSLACAWRGDFAGSVRAIGHTIATLDRAAPADQVRCATALLVSNEVKRAFPILMRNREILSIPHGQRFLARAALENNDLPVAEEALKRIADDGEEEAGTRVALDLLQAIRRSHDEMAVLGRLSQSHDLRAEPNRVITTHEPTTAPSSSWETSSVPSHVSRHQEQIAAMNRLAVQYVGAISN